MAEIIPRATLVVQAYSTNPPAPIGYCVRVDGKTIAVLTLDEVEIAYEECIRMKRAHAARGNAVFP